MEEIQEKIEVPKKWFDSREWKRYVYDFEYSWWYYEKYKERLHKRQEEIKNIRSLLTDQYREIVDSDDKKQENIHRGLVNMGFQSFPAGMTEYRGFSYKLCSDLWHVLILLIEKTRLTMESYAHQRVFECHEEYEKHRKITPYWLFSRRQDKIKDDINQYIIIEGILDNIEITSLFMPHEVSFMEQFPNLRACYEDGLPGIDNLEIRRVYALAFKSLVEEFKKECGCIYGLKNVGALLDCLDACLWRYKHDILSDNYRTIAEDVDIHRSLNSEVSRRIRKLNQ